MLSNRKTFSYMKTLFLFIAINVFIFVSQVNAKNKDALDKIYDGVIRLWVDEGQGNYSLGSAFSINEDGYFVTNHHVIASALSGNELVAIESTFPTQVGHPATIVWSSAEKDLAIIQVSGWQRPGLTLALSEHVRKRQHVTSIGFPGASDAFGADNPGFMEPKTKTGTISALTTVLPVNNINVGLFEHDATINQGSSGGPLVNECGWVVGINVSKVREIIKMPVLTELPGTPSFIEGIFDLGDVVIPVVNLASWMGITSPPEAEEEKRVIITVWSKVS